MKKILIILLVVVTIFITGCQTKTTHKDICLSEPIYFDRNYEFKDILLLKSNTIYLNDVYFDNSYKTIDESIRNEILTWSEQTKSIGILVNKIYNFDKVKNLNSRQIHFERGEAVNDNYQLIKIDPLLIFENKDNSLKINQNNIQLHFIKDNKVIFKGFLKITSSLMSKNISVTLLDSEEEVCETKLTSLNNTSGVFILPGIYDSYHYYEKLIAELHTSLNTNIHYVYYPGFYNSTSLASGFNILDLSLWVKRIISFYGYSNVGFISSGEGHLLMRKLAVENAKNKFMDNMFYLSFDPVSEQGLKISYQGEILTTKEKLLEDENIANIHQLITTKDKTTLAIQLEQDKLYAAKSENEKLNIVDEFSNKNSFLDLVTCFNNVNFQGFSVYNNSQNFQEDIDNRYSLKKGIPSENYHKRIREYQEQHKDDLMSHLYDSEIAAIYISPDTNLTESKDGDYFFKPNFRDGFIYVISKSYLLDSPMSLFENNLRSLNDIMFVTELFNNDTTKKIVERLQNLHEEQPFYYLTNELILSSLMYVYNIDGSKIDQFVNAIKGVTNMFFRINFMFNLPIKVIFTKLVKAFDEEIFLTTAPTDEYIYDISVIKVAYLVSPISSIQLRSNKEMIERINNSYEAYKNKSLFFTELIASLKEKVGFIKHY